MVKGNLLREDAGEAMSIYAMKLHGGCCLLWEWLSKDGPARVQPGSHRASALTHNRLAE